MTVDPLNTLCETGAQQLMRTQYLEAIQTLQQAEQLAWESQDWDTLSRLYLPLQEAHRQARQRCGEGAVAYDIFVGPGGFASAAEVLAASPHAQLLVSASASIEPALQVRQLARSQRLYVDAFLGARYSPTDAAPLIAIVPTASTPLPDATPRTRVELRTLLPLDSLILDMSELPAFALRGTSATYAESMAIWEQLHAPFLNRADAEPDPLHRMQLYRDVLKVDPACELAHQKLSASAREMGRTLFR